MYNTEIKMRFINDFSSSKSRKVFAERIFDALEKHEKKFCQDVCEMQPTTLRHVLADISGIRECSVNSTLSLLRLYTRWCVSNNIPNATLNLLQIETIDTDKIKTNMVSCPMHLKMYLDTLFGQDDEKTVGCIYKCQYWMAYSGMDEMDTLEIKNSDVDIENMVVRFNGKEYPIYREGLHAFKNCLELTSFRYIHPLSTQPHSTYKNRAPGDYFLRGIGLEPKAPTIQSFRVEYSRRNKRNIENNPNALRLSYKRVRLSGIFNRKYDLERCGLSISFTDDVMDMLSDRSCSNSGDGSDTITPKRVQRLISEMKTDYERWKSAFAV